MAISFLPVTISILKQLLSLLPKLQKKFSLWQRNNLLKLPNPDVKKFDLKIKSGCLVSSVSLVFWVFGFYGSTTQHSKRFSPNSLPAGRQANSKLRTKFAISYPS